MTSRYLIKRCRPQTNAEWRAERLAKDQAERIAEYHREMKEAIANAKTEKEKKIFVYEYRMFNYMEKHGEFVSLFQPADGLDEFEALIFAKAYFSRQFGACGNVGLPEKQGEEWVVQIWAGREAKPEPSIFINARTGSLRCEGHPSVSDGKALIAEWSKPIAPPR